MFLKIITLLTCILSTGCLSNAMFGSKAKVQHSSKCYEVKNGFGKHKYTPNKRYKLHGKYAVGSASYYGGKFHNRKTSGNVVFNENQMTAAHPIAVIPSIAKVTRLDTKKSVYVIITDRGPFAKKRICDLSVGAARKLDYIKKGHVKVKIEILEEESKILAPHWKKFLHKEIPNELFNHIHSSNKLKKYLHSIK